MSRSRRPPKILLLRTTTTVLCWVVVKGSSSSSLFTANLSQQQQQQQQQQRSGDSLDVRQQPQRRAGNLEVWLRGGANFGRRSFSRKRAWETAVKRGQGGFPGPMSWEPMDEEELRIKAENLLTPEVPGPVIEQFVPTRAVLWSKWRGTMLEDTWGATVLNMGAACLVCIACRRLQVSYPLLSEQLFKIDIIWKIHMTLTTFILTFFVSQSYAMWRRVYEATRHVQGRLYNLLMLTTTHLRREERSPSGFVDAAAASAASGTAAAGGASDYVREAGVGVAGEEGAAGLPRMEDSGWGRGAGFNAGNGGVLSGEARNGVEAESGAAGDGAGERKNDRGSGGVESRSEGGIVTGGGERVRGWAEASSSTQSSSLPPSSPSLGSASRDSDRDDGSSSRSSTSYPNENTILADGRTWLAHFERYTRLWQILYYASCSRKHACFCTDSGLERLYLCGLVTEAELPLLKRFPGPMAHRHMPVFQWMVAVYLKALEEGLFLQPVSLTTRVMEQFVALRDRSGGIGDMVGGRTKLAYAHTVQLLVDVFLLLTPFALFSEVGFWSIVATGVLTTFYQGLFNLSKAFIDPLNNEDATIDSDCIIIDSLIKESANMGRRWTQGAMAFPF